MINFNASKILNCENGVVQLEVKFSIAKGQFLSLFGKSGVGKTTILRILAGLEKAESCNIEVDGEIWDFSEKKIHLPVQNRSLGFVFQDFSLFPNFTVKENLQYALPKTENLKVIDEILELMELCALQNTKPYLLSGGQKQRVSLARAIVRRPKILLLDEPLSALDDEMRCKLQDYILLAHKHFQLTTIMVSHSISEIFKLSDKVIIIHDGKIQKEGIPSNVFSERKITSKFKLNGEIIKIDQSDVVYIVSILCGQNIVKVIATENEVINFKIGQKVLVASKAFNPIIKIL